MGRWTQYDEDDYRLPEGMKRVGYDSDTGRYYFRDKAGTLYEGPQGSEFGQLTKVSEAAMSIPEEGEEDDDLEAAPSEPDEYRALAMEEGTLRHQKYASPGAYRTLFPFFLIIIVVLLLVWRLILLPTTKAASKPCPDHTLPYRAKSGDTCWDVATSHGVPLEQLQSLNDDVGCDKLMPGQRLCIPED